METAIAHGESVTVTYKRTGRFKLEVTATLPDGRTLTKELSPTMSKSMLAYMRVILPLIDEMIDSKPKHRNISFTGFLGNATL